jgi:anti-sigma factor RsiW
MMDHDIELRLQAFLDAELEAGRTTEVTALLSRDPAARALFEELKTTKALLGANEPQVQVPESRDFYWSKIAREIQRRTGADPTRRAPHPVAWLRWLIPVSAVGLLALLLAVSAFLGSSTRFATAPEIENALDDTSAISFHDASEGMTVVWVSTY